MLNQYQVEQAQSQREHEVAERLRARELRAMRQRPSRSVRHAVGRSMISIGSRLASEPQPRLARSR